MFAQFVRKLYKVIWNDVEYQTRLFAPNLQTKIGNGLVGELLGGSHCAKFIHSVHSMRYQYGLPCFVCGYYIITAAVVREWMSNYILQSIFVNKRGLSKLINNGRTLHVHCDTAVFPDGMAGTQMCLTCILLTFNIQWPLLLTRFNFNPIMDK